MHISWDILYAAETMSNPVTHESGRINCEIVNCNLMLRDVEATCTTPGHIYQGHNILPLLYVWYLCTDFHVYSICLTTSWHKNGTSGLPCLNKLLNKRSSCRWFETHYNRPRWQELQQIIDNNILENAIHGICTLADQLFGGVFHIDIE